MNPKTELAALVINRIFKNSGAYTEQQVREIVFHLTDWANDLKPFADFLDDPSKCEDDEVMRAIIKFLIHAPDHLKIAAEHVLDPDAKTETGLDAPTVS